MKAVLIFILLWLCASQPCQAEENQAAVDNKKGSPTDQGEITFSDDSRYIGQLVEGKPQGKGALAFPDGSKYTGEFVGGKINGRGVMIFPDGSNYEGQFKDGYLDGHGVITYPDGGSYEGRFKNDSFEGDGVWVSSYGFKYKGQFKENRFDGEGVFSLPDGSTYVGRFKDDKPYGQGSWIMPQTEQKKSIPDQVINNETNIAPEGDAADIAPSASAELAFSVQVGAFHSSRNAEQLGALLKEKGYEVRIVPPADDTRGDWYTVRIGSYPTLEEAREKATIFTEKEKMTATVQPIDSL